jgi:CoA:oxalate CoA-transferase
MGYGWNDLHAALPGLVYAALSGFGQTGPESGRPAYDTLVQARGGVMSITGETGRAPVRVGADIGDVVAGLFLAQGVLAALFDRSRTGKGRMIDVSMLDSQLAILEQAIAAASIGARAPAPSGTRHPSVAPSESFEAADGPFVIAAGNDALFEKLCIALDLPLTGDARFATNAARCRHVRLLKRLIEAATIERPRAHWIAKLEAAGIPAGPIQTVDQVIKDPQIRARNMIVDVLDKNGRAAFKAAGNPVKMTDAADPTARPPAPELDGNRGEILRWLDGE